VRRCCCWCGDQPQQSSSNTLLCGGPVAITKVVSWVPQPFSSAANGLPQLRSRDTMADAHQIELPQVELAHEGEDAGPVALRGDQQWQRELNDDRWALEALFAAVPTELAAFLATSTWRSRRGSPSPQRASATTEYAA